MRIRWSTGNLKGQEEDVAQATAESAVMNGIAEYADQPQGAAPEVMTSETASLQPRAERAVTRPRRAPAAKPVKKAPKKPAASKTAKTSKGKKGKR